MEVWKKVWLTFVLGSLSRSLETLRLNLVIGYSIDSQES